MALAVVQVLSIPETLLRKAVLTAEMVAIQLLILELQRVVLVLALPRETLVFLTERSVRAEAVAVDIPNLGLAVLAVEETEETGMAEPRLLLLREAQTMAVEAEADTLLLETLARREVLVS